MAESDRGRFVKGFWVDLWGMGTNRGFMERLLVWLQSELVAYFPQ
jgi:hypothetical protein